MLRQYVYGSQYLDELVARRDPSDGSLKFYLQDANYNVVALADDEGAVVERYWYEPYGKVTITAPNGSAQQTILNDTHLFQGQRRDPETGLYYFKNRYYSPELGRFLQRDPAEYKDGMNLYTASIAWNALDPLGLRPLNSDEKRALDKLGKLAEEAAKDDNLQDFAKSVREVRDDLNKIIDGLKKDEQMPAGVRITMAALIEWAKQDPSKQENYAREGKGKSPFYSRLGKGKPKCNLFVADILYRALGAEFSVNRGRLGFRTIHM